MSDPDKPSPRRESDLLGTLELAKDCPWGIHTERARANFPALAGPVSRRLIHAYAQVKKACAQANSELGYLDAPIADALLAACDDVAAGLLDSAFPLEALQGGAGTSTNMNVNEVLANRALERMGKPRGAYDLVHPLDHVNLHQSTNDTYPTALRLAALDGLREAADAFQSLQGALQEREKALAHIVTLGRTESLPAVPMTLGQIFGGMAEALARDRWRTFKCSERLRVVNLGGTAVGTGVGAPRDYIFLVAEKLRLLTGYGFSRGENLPGETAFVDALVEVSGILKAAAANLLKVARDLRRLHIEGEIRLPPLQAGSSIMPGKVNPVLCEYTVQAGLWCMAQDALVGQCAAWGTLQICEWLPLLAQALLGEIEGLAVAARALAAHVQGIEGDPEVCARHLSRSPGLAAALVPLYGYARVTEWVRSGSEQGVGDWRSFLEQQAGEDRVAESLRPERLLQLGAPRLTSKGLRVRGQGGQE